VVTCEGEYYHLAFLSLLPSQNPRSPGTSPLGLTSLNRKNLPIEVTVVGLVQLRQFDLLSSVYYLTTNCAIMASHQHHHEAENLQHEASINILWYSDKSKGSAKESRDSLGYKILIEIPLLTKDSIYMHKYSDSPSLRTFGICSGMISPLGYKILTELPVIDQDTIVSSTLLPLSREVLSNYTKIVSKVLKLYTR
jgi:hypothetical protein